MRFAPIQLLTVAILILAPADHLNAVTSAIVDPAELSPIQGADSPDGKKIMAKLNSIIIPKVDFDKFDIANVVEFMTIKSKELDPENLGVLFRLEAPARLDSKSPQFHREVSITLTDDSLQDLLAYVCEQTSLRYKIANGTVVLYLSNPAQRLPH